MNKPVRKNTFRYPSGVLQYQKIKMLNINEKSPIWVTILYFDDHKSLLDLRMWRNNRPTAMGVFMTHRLCLELLPLIDRFLAGENLID